MCVGVSIFLVPYATYIDVHTYICTFYHTLETFYDQNVYRFHKWVSFTSTYVHMYVRIQKFWPGTVLVQSEMTDVVKFAHIQEF